MAALGQVAGDRYSRPTLGEGKGPSDGECHIRFTSGFYTENMELCQECAKSSMSASVTFPWRPEKQGIEVVTPEPQSVVPGWLEILGRRERTS